MKRWLAHILGEPPGFWLGRPHLGARWRIQGKTYRLVSVEDDISRGGGSVRLEYLEESECERRGIDL